jgi:hypothetical protein
MSVKKFKFVSPGIFINEIDNSQLPALPEPVGPVVIGRAERGPALTPVRVESFEEFVRVFGSPIPGGAGGDVWREGNKNGPTYGGYAAKAWLRNNSPLTYVRLLGAQHQDATTDGKAGWQTSAKTFSSTVGSNGGAYGLFIIDSGSFTNHAHTGTLAAVWYLDEGAIELSGNSGLSTSTNNHQIGGTAVFVQNSSTPGQGNSKEFKVRIFDEDDALSDTVTFNFNPNSHLYIRNVFNTNPQKSNSTVVTDTKTYWLGETFERAVETKITGSSQMAIILGLGSGSSGQNQGDMRQSATKARTGWFFSQDITDDYSAYKAENMQKLFRIVALSEGEWLQNNLKVSVENITPSRNSYDPYGTFSVVVRRLKDNDRFVEVVERFDLCNLNPNSDNYVGKKIGDYYEVWSDNERRYTARGNFPNQSAYVYVEMNADVDDGATDTKFLPYGVQGPPQFRPFQIISGSSTPSSINDPHTSDPNQFLIGNNNLAHHTSSITADGTNDGGRGANAELFISSIGFTGSAAFTWPHFALRVSASEAGTSKPQRAFFGFDSLKKGSKKEFEPSNIDIARVKHVDFDSYQNGTLNNSQETSWWFSLDDVRTQDSQTDIDKASDAVWVSGSRAAGTSVSAVSSSYSASLDAGWNRFTAPFFGGFDGLDIKEIEPFRNTGIAVSATETNAYEFNSIKRAIDSVGDAEIVEMNLASIPGLTNPVLTEHLIDVCSQRGDSLAVIDLQHDYQPSTEGTSANGYPKQPNVSQAVKTLRNRAINSSYGAAYFPWLRMRDEDTASSLWVPPSVAALGVMSNGDARHELWFAPAGFTRGGLAESAGVKITGVRQKLTSDERDKLYEANVNPIASFPAEGIVIFGQKTLQVTPSALDRINVRRLLIFLKKEISRMAATVLFDQNVQQTWTRFLGKVVPFLDSVKSRLGLVAYKVILDETTTTPELIDRNIMYAKIILKPARAIEFIALDFVITDSGASFED